jgi:hypothetical protein
MSEMEHGRWNAERLLAGWKLGPRDDDAKRHPDLVPWRELPLATREYDRAPMCQLARLLADLGYEIVDLDAAEAS